MSSASLLQNNPDHPSYDDLALTVAKQQQEIELYKFQLDQLKQYVYGRRSEKQYPVSPLQGNLFEQPVVEYGSRVTPLTTTTSWVVCCGYQDPEGELPAQA